MTIPPDIQKAAASVYAQLGRGADADEKAIAQALIAERERAAVIAEMHDHQGVIAAAIRSPHPSPTAGAK